MSVVVVAPASEKKAYSLEDWAAATDGYARILAVEAKEWEWGDAVADHYDIEVVYYSARGSIYGSKYNAAWQRLLLSTHAHEFILCLDTDVIPPEGCNIVELLYQEWNGDDFVRHAVPWRESYGRPGRYAYETGCTFGKREAWEHLLASCHGEPLYSAIHRAVCKDVALVELEHRDGGEHLSPRNAAIGN